MNELMRWVLYFFAAVMLLDVIFDAVRAAGDLFKIKIVNRRM